MAVPGIERSECPTIGFSFSRSFYNGYSENYERNAMENLKKKIVEAWNDNPVAVIAVGALAVGAIAKLIDASSAAQGRRAYARQVDYKITHRK